MENEQEIQEAARAIVFFTDSYTQNKKRKEKEQPESKSNPSLTEITANLQSLQYQTQMNMSCKQVIQIPNLLQSLIELTRFKLDTHFNKEKDLLELEVRHSSRRCLYLIQRFGDEQDQTELVNQGYGRVISFSYCTAGGIGEEHNKEINDGLLNIYNFLKTLHEGRNNNYQPSFQPLPLLARRSDEQKEEEGADEEIEAQMKNNGHYDSFKHEAIWAKVATLNRFIHDN
ncbi:MAG: hypothetical protein EZS28_025315 [Streblomastix strix]|uniref:Uncharacterized protein n=1 Tax=Streblomastix strix TaxID=222440 RepID=A0A5J4V9C6_9EUKA|nr:MAG: hypothetical protein EZS28_025315 [Streblomastix strix]